MKVRNTADFDYSVTLPGPLREPRVLLRGSVTEITDLYRTTPQFLALCAKGWLAEVDPKAEHSLGSIAKLILREPEKVVVEDPAPAPRRKRRRPEGPSGETPPTTV